MSRKTYPLEALQGLRRQRADDQKRRLGEQARRTERARALHAASEAALRTEQGRARAELSAESSRLDRGQLCAAELARADAYRRASNARSTELARRVCKAKTELDDALQKEAAARRDLARKDAAAKAMDRHRKDWQDAAARDTERAEEEAILEQWTSKRRAGRGA